MAVSILALVVAVGGTAIAGSGLTQKEKRQSKNIAKKQVNRLAPGLSVAKANTANTANSAANAGNANLLEGSSLAQVAPGGLGFLASCSLTGSLATCGSLSLTLGRTADVAVIATTQWHSPDAGAVQASCNIRRDVASTFNVDFGSAANDTAVDQTETFVLTHVFGDTPAGTHTFEFRCSEEAQDIELVQIRLLGVVVTS